MRIFTLPLFVLSFALLLFPGVSGAQISNYETPEYAGPSARMDRAFDRYREGEQQRREMFRRNRDFEQIRRNDLNVDRHIENRQVRVHSEMDRRREEVRRQKINE